MATIKHIYLASDGKEFDNEVGADRHDTALRVDAELTAYVNAVTFKTSSEKGLKLARGALKRTLGDFLHWRETGQVVQREAEKPATDEPAANDEQASAAA